MTSVVILVPIYKPDLTPLESLSLDHALPLLEGYDVKFLAPAGLDISFYERRYRAGYVYFDPQFFRSVGDYSRLLLAEDFYSEFLDYEFMLILQTDVFLFRNDLARWLARPFDYVGAPWPEGYELLVNCDRFVNPYGRNVFTHVGNGGLSLRRVRKCISLIREFPDATRVFSHTGSNEDLFFSMMGSLSEDFVIPNQIMASRFCLELRPDYYYGLHGGELPMGAHAWWRTNPQFWIPHIRALTLSGPESATLDALESALASKQE